jgi:hypothetical protein
MLGKLLSRYSAAGRYTGHTWVHGFHTKSKHTPRLLLVLVVDGYRALKKCWSRWRINIRGLDHVSKASVPMIVVCLLSAREIKELSLVEPSAHLPHK